MTKNWDSGDHEKGYYESPLFLNRDDAYGFLKLVWGPEAKEECAWWSSCPYGDDTISPQIEEIEIMDSCPEQALESGKYLTEVYT